MSLAERLTGLSWKANAPIALIGLGHGATHWIAGTFYLLLPAMSSAFDLSYTQVGALVSTFHVASFVTNLGSGTLVDVTGRRVVFQILSLLIGGLALALMGVIGAFLWIAAMAALIGATNNLWHPPAISFLSTRFPDNRGYALSIHTLGASIGDAAAPLAVGALMLSMNWQSAAMFSLVPVVAVIVLIAFTLWPMDRVQAAQGGTAGKGMSLSAYFTGLGGVLRNKAVLGLCLMTGFRSMAQNGLLMFLPLYLANELGASTLMMGAAMTAMQLGGLLAGPVAGVLSDRIGRRPVVVAGLSGSTVVIAALTLAGDELTFIAGVAVLGFVLYAVRPVVHSWMMDMTPREMGGSATSLMFGSQSALSIGMPIVGGMLADSHGLTSVFYLLAGVMLASNLVAIMLPKDRAAPAETK